jgi:hypothetical protein
MVGDTHYFCTFMQFWHNACAVQADIKLELTIEYLAESKRAMCGEMHPSAGESRLNSH